MKLAHNAKAAAREAAEVAVDTVAGVVAEVAVVTAAEVVADAVAVAEVVAVVGVGATAAATAVEIAKISSGSNAPNGRNYFFCEGVLIFCTPFSL
jgi:hypothetical protein